MIRLYWLVAAVLCVALPCALAAKRSTEDAVPWLVFAVLAGLVLALVAVLWEPGVRDEYLDSPTQTEEPEDVT